MADVDGSLGHVFISHVPEDSVAVDALQYAVEAAGFRVWRAAADLLPGEEWRARIRQAISGDTRVFLACFSARALAKERSDQRTELDLGIREQGVRSPDVPWLIPVRLDDCAVPDWDLGLGRTLSQLRTTDLFGDQRDAELELLIRAIGRAVRPGGADRRDEVMPTLERSPAARLESCAVGLADARKRGRRAESFSEQEIEALAQAFPPVHRAEMLLDLAGIPLEKIPNGAFMAPVEYWWAVSRAIENKVVQDGRQAVIAAAHRQLPYNEAFLP